MLTKICNDILPTHAKLFKEQQHSNDKCTLCGNSETSVHLIQCKAESRTKWQRQLMTKLWKKFDKHKTDHKLKETMCMVIADWMENNTVDIYKFPQKYHDAMITQENIGWSHMFAGHISQEWIKLYKESRNTNTNENQQDQSYLWGASVVEVLLSEFVRLWEIRNEEVHGKTKERNETLQKKKLTIETKRLNSLKDDARSGD